MSSTTSKLKLGLTIGIAALVIVLLLVFYGDVENPKKISLARMNTVEMAINSFIEANGRAPSALSELGLPEEALQDHIGEPFKYIVTEDSVTVLSYGSDKESGGSFFKRDYSVTVDLP
ncbi:hypothetical protein [Pelagicoccus sp. SDUM812002]|uniref:hypothetical protein n=1 Tax=Pelagicoccus sp. SDUM812002 TaxID=3041266 RepID=UPI00280F5076|nr:hypothetical protein [Pelagicoccus sp. SDUM812002]MDQ8188294.1 hypothetical protein [Pelagicoccus sp. SDUM812002]